MSAMLARTPCFSPNERATATKVHAHWPRVTESHNPTVSTLSTRVHLPPAVAPRPHSSYPTLQLQIRRCVTYRQRWHPGPGGARPALRLLEHPGLGLAHQLASLPGRGALRTRHAMHCGRACVFPSIEHAGECYQGEKRGAVVSACDVCPVARAENCLARGTTGARLQTALCYRLANPHAHAH